MVGRSAIKLNAASKGPQVRYERADLLPIVAGKSVQEASHLIARLLPICANAQSITFERAFDAAVGREESDAEHADRERRLLDEQGRAAAWRILIDFPRVLGKPAQLAELKKLRRLESSELGFALRGLVPTALEQTAACPMAMLEALSQPDVHQNFGDISELLKLAAAMPQHLRHEQACLLKPSAALKVLETQFDFETVDRPAYVGPLAMARHGSSSVVSTWFRERPILALIVGQLLDSLWLSEALMKGRVSPRKDVSRNVHGAGLGIGMTARGPLVHQVTLDDRERIADWRFVAPTDWHLSENGMASKLLVGSMDERSIALLMLAFDPCAAWSVVADGDDARRAA